MGVDIGISIKMLDENDNVELEINVSNQDNSLASILEGGSVIRYTSLLLNSDKFLTTEEFDKIKLNYDPTEEMIVTSQIIESNEAVRLFEKIFRFTYRRLSQSLENDLSKVNELELEEEKKSKRKESRISDYIGFEYSLGVAIGILKFASKEYPKVQIVGEYY